MLSLLPPPSLAPPLPMRHRPSILNRCLRPLAAASTATTPRAIGREQQSGIGGDNEDDPLARLRALLARADDPSAPEPEVDAAEEAAMALALELSRSEEDEEKEEGQEKEKRKSLSPPVRRRLRGFGRAATPAVPGMKLPYRAETPGLDCVDDPASTHYNTLVDRGAVPRPDWNRAEHLLAVGDPYRLGVVVDHNPAPAVAGGGSCIFLHLWQGPGRGTSGCTAMADADLERLLGWLDPAAGPVLVQLPAQTYAARRKEWDLPPAPGR